MKNDYIIGNVDMVCDFKSKKRGKGNITEKKIRQYNNLVLFRNIILLCYHSFCEYKLPGVPDVRSGRPRNHFFRFLKLSF